MVFAVLFLGMLFGNEQQSLQRYCDREARALGLNDWHIVVVLENTRQIGYPTYLGHVQWNGKVAIIRVLQRREYRQTDCRRWRADQKDTIRHELTHILYHTVDEETFVERTATRLK